MADAEIFMERVEQLREALGLSERELSMRATGKPDLLRDVRRKRHMPNAENIARVAELLDVSTDYLLGAADDPAPLRSEVGVSDRRVDFRASESSGPNLPLVGTGDCADLQVQPEEGGARVAIERATFDPDYHVTYLRRPPALRNDREAYAIYFHGSSMEPRFEAGEIGIVQPSRPAAAGDYVLVQLRNGESEEVASVIVKRLVRQTATELVLEQFNPALVFVLPRKQVKRLHRILPPSEAIFF